MTLLTVSHNDRFAMTFFIHEPKYKTINRRTAT